MPTVTATIKRALIKRPAITTLGGNLAATIAAGSTIHAKNGLRGPPLRATPPPSNSIVIMIAVLALLAGVTSIVWALQAAELHHRGEAILDHLTGLLNRHALLPRFTEITLQAHLTQQPVCLVLVDLDRFKEVNDSRGHDRGDAVLQAVAYEMRKQLRSFELIYRLGGEEFLIVLPGVGLQMGEMLAERLREAIEEAQPAEVPVTISLGVSAATGKQVDYETLFGAADAALYEAKHAGRNRVVAAAPATELAATDIHTDGQAISALAAGATAWP
jgi:diguanylate cyclase (GGDEF)-like protein